MDKGVLMNKQIQELTSWVNFNYIGLIAGVLSVAVTIYNINKYWEEIQKSERK